MKKILIVISLISMLFSSSIEESYNRSYNYEKRANYKDAIKVLIPIYNKYPKGYTINLRLGWLFFLNKKYKNALKHYQKATNVLPYSLDPKLGKMKIYLAMGEYSKVLTLGNSIIKIDYYNYYAHYYEVLALKAIKKYKLAEKLIRKILSIHPTNILFLNQLGDIYAKQNSKKAKIIFKSTLILDPNNIAAKEYLHK